MSLYLRCTYASKYHFSVKDVISATTCGARPTSLRRPGIPGPTRSLSSHIRDLGSTNIYTSRPTDGKLSVLVWPIDGLRLIQSSYYILLRLIADGALYDEPMGCRLWSLFLRELLVSTTQVRKFGRSLLDTRMVSY